MKLIGISGKKKAGKSLIADYIYLYQSDVIIYNFADELKKEVAYACNTTVEYINNNKDLFRPILQWWGTDFRRGKDVNYWIKKWHIAIGNIASYKPACTIVAADVRFHNEIKIIEQLGGKVWRVERIGLEDDWHPSEIELDGYEFKRKISNDGSKEDLAKKVRELLNIK